eukprot:6477327-Amphidinium_carterae.5
MSWFRASRFRALNAALVAVRQLWSDKDYPISHGNCWRGCSLCIPRFVDICKQRGVLIAIGRIWPSIRSPMPVDIMLACSVTLWVVGMRRTACALLLGFHALLRLLELASIQRKHLMLGEDLGFRQGHGIISIPHSKTAIDDHLVLALLEAVVKEDQPHHLLVLGGLHALQRRYQLALRLMNCASCGFRRSSLRGGGATEFMLRTQNVAALQFRGRWASSATMQHYVHVSLGASAMAAMQPQVRHRVEGLADLAPIVLSPEHAMPHSELTPDEMGIDEFLTVAVTEVRGTSIKVPPAGSSKLRSVPTMT